jgi:cobalt/nickel transport system ATP-binding protein
VTESVFRAEGIAFSYGDDLPALADVSFEIVPGESVCLLGSNGCGKSTLLRLLDALLLPTKGTLAAFGRPLDRAVVADEAWNAEFRRRVGIVFQDADVQLFSATVLEDVAFGPLQLGLGAEEARARALDLLDVLGISKLAKRSPATLSGGEKRRAALAACLATDPDVVLFDEPFAGLDPRSQVTLVEIVRDLKARGKTLVTATHDLTLAEEIAGRAIVLSESHRIAADGKTSAILADTALLLAANLIHEHPHDHGTLRHAHPHGHGHGHGHGHEHDHRHDQGHEHGP